ncbi:MAG: hypothetical protein O2856_14220, partial [Planctomycetota bacterium]|nr:hypothetical protein [Planctomycetota bacterium]
LPRLVIAGTAAMYLIAQGTAVHSGDTSLPPVTINCGEAHDGTPERIPIDLDDPVSNTSATNIDLFSCMYDETDSENPYKGWLFFANWGQGREGTYFVQSPDGKQWKRGARRACGQLADNRPGRSHDEWYGRRLNLLS